MNKSRVDVFLIVLFLTYSTGIGAYIGPGAGVGSVLSALAFVLIVVLLVFGFLWYPLKQIFAHRKKTNISKSLDESGKNSESDEAQGL